MPESGHFLPAPSSERTEVRKLVMMVRKYFCSPLFVMVRDRSLYPVRREDHSSTGIPIPGFEVESFVMQTGREGFE